jgi:dinuclear metal center YbgI/SA1388 family protein
MTVLVRDIQRILDGFYDPRSAESWDTVGLICGRPDVEVEKVLFAVDICPAVVAEAIALGADLIITHHPLFLRGVHSVAATTPKGRMVHDLISHQIALFNAHTNADSAPGGVNEALARVIGIVDPQVALADLRPALDKLVVFAPESHADAIRDALAEAGAGQLGDYDRCSFTGAGEGRFRPREGATPTVGTIGQVEALAEVRIETVVDRSRRGEVVAAMLAAHPYELPAYDVIELANGAELLPTHGHGRIGDLAEPTTLAEFAASVAAALQPTAHGVRVAGDPGREVRRVVVSSGAGDFMLDDVLAMDADVYVTSDLRHHRAIEFLEYGGPALVDISHWAAEWTWLPLVAERLAAAVAATGDTVETHVSTVVTDAWSFRVDPAVEPHMNR